MPSLLSVLLSVCLLLSLASAQTTGNVDLSTLPSSIIAIRHQTIPASVQPIEHGVSCAGCFDYSVAATLSIRNEHLRSTKHEDYQYTEMELPWKDCVNDACKTKTVVHVEKKSPAGSHHLKRYKRIPVNYNDALGKAAGGGGKRKLLQWDVASFAIATAALVEVKQLRSAFNTFQNEVIANLTQVQNQVNDMFHTVVWLVDSVHRISANLILQVAQAQILTMRTNIRLASAMLRITHIPAYAAAATLAIAGALNPPLNVPVSFGYPVAANINGDQVKLSDSMTNTLYHYFGLVDNATVYVQSVLTTLGYVWNPCNQSSFLIADINETLMPWGSVFYSAIVYAVFPRILFDPTTTSRSCTSSGFSASQANAGCFMPPIAANVAERIRRTTLYQGGSIYSQIVPVSAHDSRASLATFYTFNELGYVDTTQIESQCTTFTSPSLASNVILPTLTNVPLLNVPGNADASQKCYNSTIFAQQYTNNNNNNLCTNANVYPAGKVITPPAIGSTPFPIYQGEIDYTNNGTITFRTLGISSDSVNVYLLRSNVTYFYHSDIGLAKTPDFYDEWITEDGRSVPDELMQQYAAWGLVIDDAQVNKPYTSLLQGLVSIPAKVFTLPPLNDKDCYSEACARNRLNYEWDGLRYGQARFPVVIAEATNPITCSATYDCNTVGAAHTGVTPSPCLDTQAVCCNAQGYICYVKFSGTDSTGQTIGTTMDTVGGVPVQQYLQQTLPTILPNYDFLNNLDKSVEELKRQMAITFPVTFVNTPDGVGDVFQVIAQAIVAAATLPLEVVDKAGNLISKLNPLSGLSSGLDSFLGILMSLIQVVFIIGIVACVGYCIFQGFSLMKSSGGYNHVDRQQTGPAGRFEF